MKAVFQVFLLSSSIIVASGAVQSAFVPWNFNSGSEQVWYGDELIFENYVGRRSYEYDANFTYDSQYRICSNSKLFTAVSILQLVEQGKIGSIYDNINDYLNATDMEAWGLTGQSKWCPTVYGQTKNICQNNQNITFVALMSMQAGIVASVTCAGYSQSDWQYQYCVLSQFELVYFGSIGSAIAYFASHPLQSPPGIFYNITNLDDPYPAAGSVNNYYYANENFLILAYLVEKISGQALRTYYKQHIFDVVGLADTFYDPYSEEFAIQRKLSDEYYFYTELPFPPSVYPGSPSGTYPPYAIGSCTHNEVDPGFQNGAGGIVSTLPDLVKWYTSLFIAKNTTVLSKTSIEQLIYPWAFEAAFPLSQYYGLGVEVMYLTPYLTPPTFPVTQSPVSIFYMGGSMCTFFTILLWNSSTNAMGGDPLVTYPLVTTVARNNRILNVSQASWNTSSNARSGTWDSLSQAGNPIFQGQGWSDGECCGYVGGALTDTIWASLDLAMYVGGFAFSGPVTSAPTAAPTSAMNPASSSSVGKFEVQAGNGATAVITVGVVIGAALLTMVSFWYGNRLGSKKSVADDKLFGNNNL